MNLLSANNFFSKIFDWFASLSSKLPAIDYKTYFIVVVSLIIGIGVIVALTYFGSYRFKLLHACNKIIRYLAGVDAIDNDNFGDFTAQCFSAKVPSALRDCWVQYLGVRFGYPSDIVSEQNVYDKEVKRVREIRANVYIAIALVLTAIFAFWGYGRLQGNEMGVIFLASLLLSGVIYLVLVILNRTLSAKCLFVFNNMQEDLDAKVVFQVEKSFATDSSPLADLSAIIDEIVARNTAKDIGFEFADEQTPIEELIAKSSEDGEQGESEEAGEDKPVAKKPDMDDVIAKAEEFVKDEQGEDVEDVPQDVAPAPESAQEEPETQKEAVTSTETAETVDNAEPAVEPETVSEEKPDNTAETDETDENSDAPNDVEGANETPNEEVLTESQEAETIEAEDSEPASVESADVAPEADGQARAQEEPEATQAPADAEVAPELQDGAEKATDGSDKQVQEDGQAEDNDVQDEPVVRYVVDGPSDDDEVVKPAKLVKMPNLVDYVIAQNMSNNVKMNLATKLMSTYKKFESSADDKKIIKDCVKKLMANLQDSKNKPL